MKIGLQQQITWALHKVSTADKQIQNNISQLVGGCFNSLRQLFTGQEQNVTTVVSIEQRSNTFCYPDWTGDSSGQRCDEIGTGLKEFQNLVESTGLFGIFNLHLLH